MDSYDRLRKLAGNMSWAWKPEIGELFRELDPALWRAVDHNPVVFLKRLPEQTVREKDSRQALEGRLTHAFHDLHDYLQTARTWGDLYAGPLLARPVAYFSAEFGLHEALPIYSGGLGVLAGDHLKAASDLGVPIIGVGLYYTKGYFNQRLDKDGWQQEQYLTVEVDDLPLEPARSADGDPLQITLHLRGGGPLLVRAWLAHIGRCRLLLLDTNVNGNSEDDRALTARLYGGDNRVRIRQELVLGIGGMRALAAMGIHPSVLHLNEGHSAFAVLELARMMMERDGKSFEEVRERAASQTVFTTHTPVEAGHDRFKPSMVEEVLGPLRDKLGISGHHLLALGRADPHNHEEPFCMTVLALKMSRARNAVSALHGRVSRSMWRHLWPGRSEDEVPIGHITNGVHVATWLAAPMARLYEDAFGKHWLGRLDMPGLWEAVDQIDDAAFWKQHQLLRHQLVEYVRRCVEQQREARGEGETDGQQVLEPDVLTIGFARRFASYKRADLLLRDLDRLDALVNDPQRPVQLIFAGKAHPADDSGKRVIQGVFNVTRDPRFAGRIVFIENYNMNVVRHLVQGVDLWLNNPRRPLEACGTSGQKVILNGGLNLSILDGWWAECYDGRNGFAIGGGNEHRHWQHQDDMDHQALYEALENQVVPMFYDRDAQGVPRDWVAREKHAIQSLAWRCSAQRMLIEYTLGCYLPAAGGVTTSFLPPRAAAVDRFGG
ncbi:MAG: alpha-glucan family phosphorylase [Phycisphaeraceae bacterium]